MNRACLVCYFLLFIFGIPVAYGVELSVSAKGELHGLLSDSDRFTNPWFEGGTGNLIRNEDGFWVGPQVASLLVDTETAFSARVNAQWHSAPEAGAGVTEAWLAWAPLPVEGYRVRGRFGIFYPAFSVENTDVAWTSPYTSSFSAINSWYAEELRARGAELSVSRPGHFFDSPHSWTFVAGAFQGNDALGSILVWRGFALHNLQTSVGERVEFASYPSLREPPLELQPAWVEPTRELDHATGFYAGVHWQYLEQTGIDVYYYDNQGDPLVFRHGQYAWRTRFLNVALEQQLTDRLVLIGQWLQGDTLMGPAAVAADFSAWFGLLHWQQNAVFLSARYDHYRVTDRDQVVTDNNNGKGEGYTLAVGYQLHEKLSLAVEYVQLESVQQNRLQWYWPARVKQANTSVVVTWRW
jgi:hypothetical protein